MGCGDDFVVWCVGEGLYGGEGFGLGVVWEEWGMMKLDWV